MEEKKEDGVKKYANLIKSPSRPSRLENIGSRRQSSRGAHHLTPEQSSGERHAQFLHKLEQKLASLGWTEG